ncbi:MAG: hypothetical protein J5J00_01365 [Deltaproteobacteria bacterium]|nr:hypothetical protein [Deltaproteobacteria bacterium]
MVFETLVAAILLTPALAFLLADYHNISFQTYLISFFSLCAVFIVVSARKERASVKELYPLGVLLAAFYFFLSYILRWPDFIAIGERLRDFAILSSVIHSPVRLEEPWMAGYPLNYYGYWYRVGHMLHTAFDWPTWQVYHSLQAFTYALYFTCSFRIFSKYLSFSYFSSIFFSLLITLGSNLSGVLNYLNRDHNWWGPSRVINGAINEFPAWSFLLGDLHPHYLNLPLLPFLTLLLLSIAASVSKPSRGVIFTVAAAVTAPLWIYNANTWEVPVWFALLSGLAFSYLLLKATEYRRSGSITIFPKQESFDLRSALALLLLGILTAAFYGSSRNIIPPDYPVDFVHAPIPRTTVHEMALHFGIPLLVITMTFVIRLETRALRLFSALGLAALLISGQVLPFLVILLGAAIYRAVHASVLSSGRDPASFAQLAFEGIGAAAIGLLIVPEIVFLNDPYGAEIERMNTIFKIYSAAWFWLHLYAFYLLGSMYPIFKFSKTSFEQLSTYRGALRFSAIYVAPIIISFGLMTGFFRFTATELRSMKDLNIQPINRGLSEINKQFPGAASSIKALDTLPRGIVLEAQGKPYDYTTHIATLSGMPAYLGWANHVNLLLSNDPEIRRREEVTEQFYKQQSCQERLSQALKERIRYVILGPLEKQRYQGVELLDWSCFRLLFEEGSYKIFASSPST